MPWHPSIVDEQMKLRRPLCLLVAALLCACGGDATAPREERPREAVRLANSDGDQQTGYTAMPLPINPSVTALDQAGRGVPGVIVRFSTAGGGWVTDAEVVTDSFGVATTTWYLGPAPGGTNFLYATSPVGGTGFRAHSLPLTVGETYRGRTGLIEFTMGDAPLILTAPHGGTQQPEGMPARTTGSSTSDDDTAELVTTLAAQFRARGATPFTLVSRVHRSRMDADAVLAEGAQGHRLADQAWREYHGFLVAARNYIQAGFERGLLVDVHGHQAQAIELGYLLTAADLAQPDEALNDPSVQRRSSIRALATDNQSAFSTIVRGGSSLGALLTQRGFPAAPSPSQPGAVAPYEVGGFTTTAHGSRDAGFVSSIFVDVPAGMRTAPTERTALASAMLESLNQYFLSFYRGNSLVP